MKTLKNIFLVSVFSLVICFVLMELFFTFVIPASESPYYCYDEAEEMMRFDKTLKRNGESTYGKYAERRFRWRVNNYGWNSEIDYQAKDELKKPLIAVIGDSYINGLTIDVDKKISAVLRSYVQPRYEVYSFGMDGAPLSQYLNFSRYAGRHFDPDVLLITVIHNDFLESLQGYTNKDFFLLLRDSSGTIHEVEPTPYVPNHLARFLRKSSFVRYIYINLGITSFTVLKSRLKLLKNHPADNSFVNRFNANIDVQQAVSRREEMVAVTEYTVGKIRSENPDREIIFMIDAPRRDIYQGTVKSSSVKFLYDILKEACEKHDCYFIDLTGPFQDKYSQDSIKFNSDNDFHWDEVGHKLAASTVYDFMLDKEIITME